MSVRLGVLVLVSGCAVGCATAPVRDDNLERIEKAMVAERGELPAPIALGQDAPPLAPAPPPPAPVVCRPRYGRGRVISHTYPGHIPEVTIGW